MDVWSLIAADDSTTTVGEQMEDWVRQADVSAWFEQAKIFVAERAADFALRLIAALALYYVGRWVAGIAVRLTQVALERAKVDVMLVRFAANVLHAIMMTMIVIGSLQLLGVDMTSMTAVLAAAGFAIGLALQGSLSNFASGILLVVFKPFRVGDRVDAGSTSGQVEEIHLFTTILRTPDNARIIVPNGQITSSVITNYSAFATRRIDLIVGCGYADDLRAVKAYLLGVLERHPKVLHDPAPTVAVCELADSCVNFEVRPWVRTEDFGAVRSELLEEMKLGFDENGFTIPYPSQDVYVQAPPQVLESLKLRNAA